MNSLFLIVIVPILMLAVGFVYAQEENSTEHVPKFFAIQHAQSGSLSEINETAYSLQLNDVSDKTILFSET